MIHSESSFFFTIFYSWVYCNLLCCRLKTLYALVRRTRGYNLSNSCIYSLFFSSEYCFMVLFYIINTICCLSCAGCVILFVVWCFQLVVIVDSFQICVSFLRV